MRSLVQEVRDAVWAAAVGFPPAGGRPIKWWALGLGRRRRQPPRPGSVPAHTAAAACSKTSRPCTWTRLGQRPHPPLRQRLGPQRRRLRPPRAEPASLSASDGPSNAPTRRCRTSGSSAATPTGAPSTDSPNSPSSSSHSSAPNSSTGETAGHHLSANALIRVSAKPGAIQCVSPLSSPDLIGACGCPSGETLELPRIVEACS